jgi:hypothetical protein
MPRERLYKNNAERQAAHRERTKLLRSPIRRMLDELASACDRGRCSRFADNLPEEDTAAIEELARRLREVRIIVCKPE